MPHTYKKKPVEIQAAHLTASNVDRVAEWCGGKIAYGPTGTPDAVLIETLEGTMRADFGDFVIRGLAGEFYPCKANIFSASYDAVESDDA